MKDQNIPMYQKMSKWDKRPFRLNRELSQELREKTQGVQPWKEKQTIQEEYKDVVR